MQVGGLGWPLSGTLLAGYGGTLPDGGSSSGLLIGATTGTTVKAVANGKVVFADWMNGYGLILIIDHGNGYMSLYAHNEALLRDAGDDVKRGDAVASVGNSGDQARPGAVFRAAPQWPAGESGHLAAAALRGAAQERLRSCNAPLRDVAARVASRVLPAAYTPAA